MSVTDTPPQNWKQKADQAQKLISEVKSLNLEGSNGDTGISPEQAASAKAKVQDALRLQAEARTERKAADDNLRVADLLDRFAAQDADSQSTWGAESDTTTGQKGLVTSSTSSDFGADAKGYTVEKGNDSPLAARSRITATKGAMERLGLKALNEGTAGQGGFLVPPQYLQDMFATVRRQGNALRRYGWLNIHPVETNQLLIPKGSGSATVGWVAENAPKPSADQTFTQITINIFTAAGISKLSKQLVDDSNPTATDLATRELAALIGILEEQAIISGTGVGMPRGILNTAGVNNLTLGTNSGQATIDAILDGITAVETNYFGAPNGILMTPRRLGFIQKTKDSNGNYLFNTPGMTRSPGGGSGLLNSGSQYELLGIPVGVSQNLPANLGTGTNQDAIIVADWTEAHWFQRQDQTLDASDVAGNAFETNQVWFRLEERAGFSAERYPAAFSVITGAGLVP